MSYITDQQRRHALVQEICLYDRILNWRDERTILRFKKDPRPGIATKVENLRAAAFQLLDTMDAKPTRPDPAIQADDFDDIPF